MMAPTNIRTHAFARTDRVFFDTNIWLKISNPFAPEWNDKVKVYSNAYREIINLNLKIHIDAVVLSEYINRLSRLRFDIWKVENPDEREVEFKEYRGTDDFAEAAETIKISVNEFLMDCKPIDTSISGINLVKLMDDFGGGKKDFNDQLIVEDCARNNLVLVTDDADFRGTPIPILTYNQNLLRP